MDKFDPNNPNATYDGMTAEEFAELVRAELAKVGLAHLLKEPKPEQEPQVSPEQGQTLTAIFVGSKKRAHQSPPEPTENGKGS